MQKRECCNEQKRAARAPRSASAARPAQRTLVTRSRCLEREANGFRLLGADCYALRRGSAVFFVPRLDRVCPRRQVLQFEAAVGSGDLEIWVLEDGDVALHPR